MTRVSDQAKSRETVKSIPVLWFTTICPMSHTFILEIDKSDLGAQARGDLHGKMWDMRDARQ